MVLMEGERELTGRSRMGMQQCDGVVAVMRKNQSSSSLPNSSEGIATVPENCYNHEKQRVGTVTKSK
jgi:hypothetical protein